MKSITKGSAKRFLGACLAMVMLFSAVAYTPVFAAENICNHDTIEETTPSIQPRAGTENWGKAGYPGIHVGTFNCYNNNLTPVKTITESGNFYIYGDARKSDNLNGNVVTKIQIREYPSGRVLWSGESHSACSCGGLHKFQSKSIHLNAGQRIQIFFDVCSIGTPPGGYRSALISYNYVLS